ncbi:MAG TPA: hypothetical protein VGG72_30440 [Bryobacteraceae bacterium]|jgi:hypothetical protein
MPAALGQQFLRHVWVDLIVRDGDPEWDGAGRCQWEVTHANGSLVSNTNPASAGEALTAYAVGRGATNPAVPTGQPATQPTPTAETFRMGFNFQVDAPPSSAAQLSGSPGATVTQTSTSNDLKSVHEAIDRLLATVKASPTIEVSTKNDAQIEADQLKGEVNKSKPNPNRITEALEWFKTAAGAVEVIPKIADVWDKVKVFLPGVL